MQLFNPAYDAASAEASRLREAEMRRFPNRRGLDRELLVAAIEERLQKLWQAAYDRFKGDR